MRKFFDTERDANEFIEGLMEARKEKGQSAFQISQKLAVEATELMKQLDPRGATLTDAVRFYLKHVRGNDKRTVSDLIPEYLLTKQNPTYRNAQKVSLELFARSFGKKPIASIFAPALEKWFSERAWKPLNARNYMRDLSMFFRWAEMHDYVPGNPFDKIKRPKVEREVPEIYTVEETGKLLTKAYQNEDLGLLPMYATALFAGIRIEELRRMTWAMIDWDEGEIRLPGSITKTGMPRNVEIFQALRAWMHDVKKEDGPLVSPPKLRSRRESLRELAEVPSKRNALRHSFASYHAAKFQDPGKLQLLLGQETPSVMFRHYITAIRRTDADRFFELRPPQKEGEAG